MDMAPGGEVTGNLREHPLRPSPPQASRGTRRLEIDCLRGRPRCGEEPNKIRALRRGRDEAASRIRLISRLAPPVLTRQEHAAYFTSSLSDPAVLARFMLTGLCVCCCAFDRPHHHSIVSISFSSDTGGGVREGGGCCPGPLAAESGGGVGAGDGVGAGRAPTVPPALTWSDCRWIGNLRLG
ncbi:hypothetical protein PVAP13_9KG074560 [Panicum virgatum]|uniref:Uncharacterized protein n=1 Tax=Panicum virgatum TaxID=38727 RepID=A0A8T0NCU8_PANVG|nr:hypothetical protein PVAP13_9KG074560 [Panicum virgatum]